MIIPTYVHFVLLFLSLSPSLLPLYLHLTQSFPVIATRGHQHSSLAGLRRSESSLAHLSAHRSSRRRKRQCASPSECSLASACDDIVCSLSHFSFVALCECALTEPFISLTLRESLEAPYTTEDLIGAGMLREHQANPSSYLALLPADVLSVRPCSGFVMCAIFCALSDT